MAASCYWPFGSAALSEKTKDTGEVAYTLAIEGRVAALTALLMVAAEKVNGSVLEVRTNTDLAPEKTSVYNCVIREAVSIYIGNRGKHRLVQESKSGVDDDGEDKRKVLLKEMELLHFFGASANGGCLDKKATSPLIIASQAGDEAVMKLLLQTGINVGDADAEGNSALHWCLKASKVSSPEHIRILCLLLKHGARVRQKDKLGLTAVHIAAANGNLEALKVLLSHDPDSVLTTSELKETPLFFAAKNDFIECAQLLLNCGATTEVLNLRRERPIDLAKSQDMRAALNRTSVIITNRISQQKYTACMHNDQVVSETCETLTKEPCSSSESVGSSADGEICKYFGTATGCARGNTCFYRHVEEDTCAPKSRVGNARSTVLAEFKLKIFVGGLPPTMDSDSLAVAMEEQFGPVTDANVLKMEIDDQLMSRGFGFVTFKNEKSAAAALDAHYTNLWGKKVEMKSAVPKWLLYQEEHADERQQETVQQESTQYPTHQRSQGEQNSRENIPEKMSWADRVGQTRSDDPVNEPKARRVRTAGQDMPVWFITFKKWLPQFLRKMLKNSEGEYYSLSSLKSDFKSIFGLDLDHASLGYSKLSDFVKSMPELCRVKIVHTGGQVANHMILLPNVARPPPLVVPPKSISVPRQPTPVSVQSDYASDRESTGLGRKESESDAQSEKASESNIDAAPVNGVYAKKENQNPKVEAHLDYSRFLQFLEPDPVFLGRTWLGTGGFKVPDEQFRRKHLVLEALARKKKQVFFLRGLKFYEEYAAILKEGNCFACEKKKMLWANYPCQHLLWCGDCKLVAMSIAAIGTSAHKCVVCDEVVEKVDLIPWTRRQNQSFEDREFPPIHDAYLRSQRLQA
ncbi:Ankyrin repeat and SOCS box protein 3 [Bienertia sinuspersici]